jgi:hypothetical protein
MLAPCLLLLAGCAPEDDAALGETLFAFLADFARQALAAWAF